MPTNKVVSLKEASNVMFGVEMEFASPNFRGGSSRTEIDLDDDLKASIEKWDKSKVVDKYGYDGGGLEVDLKPFKFSELNTRSSSIFGFLGIVEQKKFTGENNDSGMHVHVDRNIFNVKHFQKFLKFLLEYKAELHAISRRGKRSSYTNVATREGKNGFVFDWSKVETWENKFKDPNEYEGNNCIVLNTHGKYGTIECRFFNSTTEVNVAIANIQFVRGLCYFIKSKRETKSWSEFLRYLNTYRSNYKELLDLIAKYPVKK